MEELRDLTEEERAVLELVIRHGMTRGVEQALAQSSVARHGGATHGNDVCFDIWLPAEVPLIPEGDEMPIDLEERPHGEIVMGSILLWITDGRLSYLELSEVSDPDAQLANTKWPALDQIVLPSKA